MPSSNFHPHNLILTQTLKFFYFLLSWRRMRNDGASNWQYFFSQFLLLQLFTYTAHIQSMSECLMALLLHTWTPQLFRFPFSTTQSPHSLSLNIISLAHRKKHTGIWYFWEATEHEEEEVKWNTRKTFQTHKHNRVKGKTAYMQKCIYVCSGWESFPFRICLFFSWTWSWKCFSFFRLMFWVKIYCTWCMPRNKK